jgi:hypothetical protein
MQSNYSKTEYGKNVLMVGDGGNSYPEFAVERRQRMTQEDDVKH